MEGLPLFNQDSSEVSHEAGESAAEFIGDEHQKELMIERAGKFALGANPLADDSNDATVDGEE